MPPENKDPFAEFALEPKQEDAFKEFEAPAKEPADPFAQFEAPEPPKMPVVQEQGVGYFERSTVNMLSGSPDEQIKYLQSEGYIAEAGPEGMIKVRRPEDKQWKVVDPEGLTSIGDAIQDAQEALPEIAMFVASGGPAGAGLKAAGGTAVKAGSKLLKPVLKGSMSIADRILSISPTYKAGKAVVKGAAKAHKQLSKMADDIANLKKAAPKKSPKWDFPVRKK